MAYPLYEYTEVPVVLEDSFVKISLPQDITKTIKKCQLSESDVPVFREETVFNRETHFARFYNSELTNPLIPSFSYRIQRSSSNEKGDILIISPIQINNFENSNLKSISFLLPSNILGNCVTFREVDHDDDDNNNSLVIDMILDVNLIITLNIPIGVFFNEINLNLNNFHSWCIYSIPYSFDQRKPLLQKSFDIQTSIISTIDGGLLLLKRPNSMSPFSISPLTNISYINNIKSKFFSLKNDRIINFADQSVSINTFIDILKVNSDLFITISVNKIINIWSISSRNILKEINLNNYLPEIYHSAILSPICPNSILKLCNDRISILINLDNTYILTFKLNLDNLSLDLEYELTPPNGTENWIPIDYSIISRNGYTKLWISWIFGESCLYQCCKIYDDINNTIEWTSTIESNTFKEFQNNSFINKVEHFKIPSSLNNYALRFIQSQFNNKTINLALNIYNPDFKDFTNNIKNHLVDYIINKFEDSSIEYLQTEWIRFTSVCQDIHNKTANKIFSINFDNSNIDFSKDPFLIVMKGNDSFSIIKKSSTFELLYFNSIHKKSINPKKFQYSDEINIIELMKLVDLILEYSKGFNNEISFSIYELIKENFTIEDDDKNIKLLMTNIFDKFIIKIANETVVSEVLNRLSNIEFASDLINFLTILLTTNFTDYKNNNMGKFTKFNEKIIIESIIFNNLIAKQILFGLTLILNTIDISKPIEILFKKLYQSFKLIEIIESVSLLGKDNNLIIDYLTRINNGITIKSDSFNLVLVNILDDLSKPGFVFFVISELLYKNESNISIEFIQYLARDNAISSVFKGLIALETGQCEEAMNIFMKNAKEITNVSNKNNTNNNNGNNDKQIDSRLYEAIKSTMKLITVDNDVDYFFNLSILFENKRYYLQALKLALESSKYMNKLKKINLEKENDIFYKIFELALNLGEYKMSFSAIKEMTHQNRIIPLRKFIYKLFQDNKLGTVIEFNYGEDLDRIDELIYNMGEESLSNIETLGDIKLGLKYYRVCYSLRLKEGDFRGSIESLYRFNNIVQYHYKSKGGDVYNNEERVKILKNNYLVMLNLMNSLQDKDDKWIISKDVDGRGDRVINGDDLEQEYVLFKEGEGRCVAEERGRFLM